MEKILTLHVKLLTRQGNGSVSGHDYSVKFFDKDMIRDDYLGETNPDEQGNVSLQISTADFKTSDSALEKYPDIYFTVYKKGKLIFKSPVCNNLHLDETGSFSVSGGLHSDLGTFVI